MTIPNYTAVLKQKMATIDISSFRVLAEQAGVSTWQVAQLRQGQVHQMRLATLLKFCQTLQLSLPDFLATFSDQGPWNPVNPCQDKFPHESSLKEEYQRLQQQLAHQREILSQEFQHTAFNTLESLLRSLPVLIHKVQENPDIPAKTVLTLVKTPIEQLLQQWGIETIAPIGAEVPYDPRWHQLSQGSAETGQPVRVFSAGYRQGEILLCRVGVKPCETH